MQRAARQASILKTLEQEGTCTVGDLARQLHCSDETIRRDLISMENKGLVLRDHGGVALPSLFGEPAFQKRMDQQADAKRAIALAVSALIADGESIMMDTGSTTTYVARALAERRELMAVTNCTEIARTLATRDRNKVYLAGGELRADDGAVFGETAITFIEQFRVSTAILSIAGIHAEDGFFDFYLSEAKFSQAVIKRAKRRIVVADHSKFGAIAPVRVCPLNGIDIVVTDQMPKPEFQERLAKAKVELIVANGPTKH